VVTKTVVTKKEEVQKIPVSTPAPAPAPRQQVNINLTVTPQQNTQIALENAQKKEVKDKKRSTSILSKVKTLTSNVSEEKEQKQPEANLLQQNMMQQQANNMAMIQSGGSMVQGGGAMMQGGTMMQVGAMMQGGAMARFGGALQMGLQTLQQGGKQAWQQFSQQPQDVQQQERQHANVVGNFWQQKMAGMQLQQQQQQQQTQINMVQMATASQSAQQVAQGGLCSQSGHERRKAFVEGPEGIKRFNDKAQGMLAKFYTCPMQFEWFALPWGYCCCGGTHFIPDKEIDKYVKSNGNHEPQVYAAWVAWDGTIGDLVKLPKRGKRGEFLQMAGMFGTPASVGAAMQNSLAAGGIRGPNGFGGGGPGFARGLACRGLCICSAGGGVLGVRLW
jgi:hypothetical protein